MKTAFSCIDCAINNCEQHDAVHPAFCPTNGFSLADHPQIEQLLSEEETRNIVNAAAYSAHTGHREKLNRLEETILFANKLGVKKIGIAACISLAAEARNVAKVLRAQGFEVVGVICKIGSVTFGELGVPCDERGPDAVLCNSVYQAQVLNEEQTDLNIVLGLCVGHDTLFLKHADAPSTVLTVKDFKFDHCSIRALRFGDESGDLERLLS